VFDQYLRDTRIPALEYRLEKNQLQYRWSDCVPEFNMPVKVKLDQSKSYQLLQPKTEWQSLKVNNLVELRADPDFYIMVRKID
jgi:hypothetical protein